MPQDRSSDGAAVRRRAARAGLKKRQGKEKQDFPQFRDQEAGTNKSKKKYMKIYNQQRRV